MPHITALHGDDVWPAPSWRLFHKHRLPSPFGNSTPSLRRRLKNPKPFELW